MKKLFNLLFVLFILTIFISCKKKEEKQPKLIFKVKFDSSLGRLDNFGNPATIPSGHSAQKPVFNSFSAHYIEFAPNALTQLGDGEVIYHGPETSIGGSKATDFNQAVIVGDDEIFYSIPLKNVSPGDYEWVRVSLTYQNYDIKYKFDGNIYDGTLASFVGFNTYITSHKIKNETVTLNSNKLQGYWAFETFGQVFQGNAPGTTVPNPIASTSPVPPGSCVVTGKFPEKLSITGKEKKDIIVTINLSTNNSFEWKDANMDGFYEPAVDTVVDMGFRGLYPTFVK